MLPTSNGIIARVEDSVQECIDVWDWPHFGYQRHNTELAVIHRQRSVHQIVLKLPREGENDGREVRHHSVTRIETVYNRVNLGEGEVLEQSGPVAKVVEGEWQGRHDPAAAILVRHRDRSWMAAEIGGRWRR